MEGIINGFRPDIILLCEVGEVSTLLDAEDFREQQRETRETWLRYHPAAGRIELSLEHGYPYMTALRADRVECAGHHILNNLYTDERGRTRTAQHFLARPLRANPSEYVNVINVHAPPPSKPHHLTDPQRIELLTNMLRICSLWDTRSMVGRDKYIIGGGMGTTSLSFSYLPGGIERRNKFWQSPSCFIALHGQHGDLGIFSGVCGTVHDILVRGTDKRHFPYCFMWKHGPAIALQQPASSVAIALQHTASSVAAQHRAPQATPPAQAADVHWTCERGHWISSRLTEANAMTQPAISSVAEEHRARPAIAEDAPTSPPQVDPDRRPTQLPISPAAAEHQGALETVVSDVMYDGDSANMMPDQAVCAEPADTQNPARVRKHVLWSEKLTEEHAETEDDVAAERRVAQEDVSRFRQQATQRQRADAIEHLPYSLNRK